ncbi:Techylectin-like protein [Araneus ventricosus]|uniref:Techylectin-like protein n=1 Tax=Araneus ventricosus TaxID=182803 RepID=A0A4Y2SV03_ARAVE|nr:Techylectin-like protein [Araneus ventricosus]
MVSYLGERRYALYDSFWIDDENHKYTLHIQDYSGDAGDSMIKHHNNRNFTTKDQDNDTSERNNCGSIYKAGWWYSRCYDSLLNGLNHRDTHESGIGGVNWSTWTGVTESLLATEIKIRPKYATKTN